MAYKTVNFQPPQRLPYVKKTKEWRKTNIDYADNFSIYYNNSVRKSIKNKVINLNLYNGILDMDDLSSVVNPYQTEASFVADKIPHNPIIVPKIDLLVGEEMKRTFEAKAVVINKDAISEKEEDKKNYLIGQLSNLLEAKYEGDKLQQELDKLGKYMTYSWQDIRERLANQILKYYSQKQHFKYKFSQCFKDALIHGEELVQIEIVQGEPTLTVLNPMKVHSVQSGNSSRIEDSQIIIIEDHWAPGKIVDYFHDELKPKDIDHIMEYTTKSSRGDTPYKDERSLLESALDHSGKPFIDDIFNIAEINGHYFNNDLTDNEGNIRVFRVYWKSIKKVQKIKYYDENGDAQYKMRSEEYIPDTAMGEESTTLWINEMWEGTKIARDIYISMKPMDTQFASLTNPSYCHAGIIGQVYNTNQAKAVSLIDRAKNYQYLYDVMWDRLNKAIATNYGKIFPLDLAKIPENWEVEKWLHFAIVNKIAVVDSFKEGNKGSATGQLAGNMNNHGSQSIDMETGRYIQSHIEMLEYIKMEMSEITGISKQRQGQISSRETLGGVERSVNQSANITEYWYTIHEHFKVRVLRAFLDAAKIALKDGNIKAQYILDDMSIQALNAEGKDFAEADYDIVVSNTSKTMELEQTIKGLSQHLIQNGARVSTIMDIYMSSGLADMRNKVENAEEENYKRSQEANEQANKVQQEKNQQDYELEIAKIEQDERKSIRTAETARYVADLKVGLDADKDGDGIADSIEFEKLEVEREKIRNEKLQKIRELNSEEKMHKEKMKVERAKIKNSNKTPKK